jgi:hypothetical protein
MTDPTGFAAMAVSETTLHTHDIAQGLGIDHDLDAGSCTFVLNPLFPDHPKGPPAELLLWLTGRQSFDGHPAKTDWVWNAAV